MDATMEEQWKILLYETLQGDSPVSDFIWYTSGFASYQEADWCRALGTKDFRGRQHTDSLYHNFR